MKIGPLTIVGTPDAVSDGTFIEFKTKTINIKDGDTLLSDPQMVGGLRDLRDLFNTHPPFDLHGTTTFRSSCYLGQPVYGVSGRHRKKFENYSAAKRYGEKFLRWGWPYRVVTRDNYTLLVGSQYEVLSKEWSGSWRTEAVVALARQIDSGDKFLWPVLMDALDDAEAPDLRPVVLGRNSFFRGAYRSSLLRFLTWGYR